MERHKTLELFDLTGTRVLVTGSSQGIGFALVLPSAELSAGDQVARIPLPAEETTRQFYEVVYHHRRFVFSE
jgi:NAD(P)-dependent dehydrogenase (short-subunit alcohol dehydrogenase family)